MAIREYVLSITADVRKRHRHETQQGKVVAFTVQLEIEMPDGWTPIVRYDMAHGEPHIDRYDISGTRTKEFLDFSSAEALTQADEDIDDNWARYVDRFGRRSR